MRNLRCFIFFVFFCANARALVDYTEETSFTPQNSSAKSVRSSKGRKVVNRITSKKKVRKTPSGMFSMGASYETLKADNGNGEDKASFLKLNGHFDTNRNIYVDFSYWHGNSKSELEEKKSNQKGNPEIRLGLNWIKFGDTLDSGNIDFIFGYSFGQKNSTIATSRSDKIVGVETSKRFGEFALGLGYDYVLTGDIESNDEVDIGNIGRLIATLGWMATSDIRFKVEGGTYSISSDSSSTSQKKLSRKLSFGYISPSVLLGIYPLIQLELGAVYRTKRENSRDLLDTKLYNLKGAYGNSIFAGLSLNI